MMNRPVATTRSARPLGPIGGPDRLTTTRRGFLAVDAALAGLIGTGLLHHASAQDGPAIETAFSTDKLDQLGYVPVTISVGPNGVDAPAELSEGWYLVSLFTPAPFVGYLNFMQPPDGLDTETANQLALDAGSIDITQSDWVYAGGTNTFDLNQPVSFAIYLNPGQYQIAASYYLPDQGSVEIMTLSSLLVTSASAAPTATSSVTSAPPPVDVRLEMTDDLRYVVTPVVVPAGAQVWEIVNTGTIHSHHVVLSQFPEGTTAEAIVAHLASLFSGTPPAGEPLAAQAIGRAYAALQSGGMTTYNEFTLEPGTYAVVCYILNIETGVPHVLDGMVTTFIVE